jgi:hypothetical protein
MVFPLHRGLGQSGRGVRVCPLGSVEGPLGSPKAGFWEPPGRGRMRARHLSGKGRKGEVGVALKCAYLAARVWPAPFRVQKGGQMEGDPSSNLRAHGTS